MPGAFVQAKVDAATERELSRYLSHFFDLLTVPGAYEFADMEAREQLAIRTLSRFYHSRRSATQEGLKQRLETMF